MEGGREKGNAVREIPVGARLSDGRGEHEVRRPFQREEGWRREEEGTEEGRRASALSRGWGQQAKGYGREQVVLSFRGRNRKGPESCNTALTSPCPTLGIPPRGYSEWLLATRRQQQTQIRPQSLKQQQQQQQSAPNTTRLGNPSPRLPSRIATMGSEVDEADSEVKWLTDVAFSSLSRQQVDYLDMYNSSHRSSTNASQPSPQESPGATAWMSYADLHSSTHGETDDMPRQPSYVPPLGGLDPARRFELGSYECVDVALESQEESRRGKRTVPKRQIQLKRRDNETKATENALDSPSSEQRFRDAIVRQHSTPTTTDDDMTIDGSEADLPERKQRIHKSLSLDETTSKTKIASCLIKNVLSKKMQNVGSQNVNPAENLSPSAELSKPFESTTPPPGQVQLRDEEVSSSQVTDRNPSPVRSSQAVDRGSSPVRSGQAVDRNPSPVRSGQAADRGSSPVIRGRPAALDSPPVKCSQAVDRDSSPVKGSQAADRHSSPVKGSQAADIGYSPVGSGQVPDRGYSPVRSGHATNRCSSPVRNDPATDRYSSPVRKGQAADKIQVPDERGPPKDVRQQRGVAPKVPPKPLHYTLPPLPQEAPKRPEKHGKSRKETPPDVTHEDKRVERREAGSSRKQKCSRNLADTPSYDSTHARIGNTGPAATRSSGMPQGMINSELERQARQENHKQYEGSSLFMSKTPEIMLRPCIPTERKQSSVKLSPRLERKVGISKERSLEVKTEEQESEVDTEKTEDQPDLNKTKKPMHKVRDVRGLVKNTYNLSFKAAATIEPPLGSDSPSAEEPVVLKPAPLQIDCRAISRKGSKEPPPQDPPPPRDPQGTASSEASVDLSKQSVGPHVPDRTTSPVARTASKPGDDADAAGLDNASTTPSAVQQSESAPSGASKHPKLGNLPRVPSKEREVSRLVFQPEGSFKSTPSQTTPSMLQATPPPLNLATPLSPNLATPSSPRLDNASHSHSVSMIQRKKGLQADIGVCEMVGGGEINSPPRKHINRLEVPLQTRSNTEAEPQGTHRKEEEVVPTKQGLPLNDTSGRQRSSSTSQGQDRKQPRVTFEDHHVDTPPSPQTRGQHAPPVSAALPHVTSGKETWSPLATRKHQPVSEVKPVSGEGRAPMLQKTSKEIELPIQVRSVSYERPKPVLPTKPSYKQPVIEIRSISNDPKTKTDRPQPVADRHTHTKASEKPCDAPPSPEPDPKSSHPLHTNQLAVSAHSTYRPPPPKMAPSHKMAATSSLSQTPSTGGCQDNKPPPTVAAQSQRSETHLTSSGTSNIPPQPVSLENPNSTSLLPREHVLSSVCAGSVQTVEPLMAQAPPCPQPPPSKAPHHHPPPGHLCFYASDDPPSYDERERFSPYLLSDLPSQRSSRYHPSTRPPQPCTCPSHPGHPRHSPHARTPPTAAHSPNHPLLYPPAPPQAQVRPHQCRPDGPPLTYKPGSPKASMLSPTHPPGPFPPPHQPPSGSNMLPPSCGDERQHPPGSHADRRPPHHHHHHHHHHHAQPPGPGVGGGPYGEPLHPPMESRPQYLCSPPDLGSTYGSDYGSDGPGGGGLMYADGAGGLGGYGQGPRRMLLDPDTGKYFYMEMPLQPLRKMLFDPETGQYVEVLIPQQTLPHSNLYPPPPAAPPYSPLHPPNMYAPQYLPYPVPGHGPTTHPPRPAEPQVPTTLHQGNLGYGNSGGQVPTTLHQGNLGYGNTGGQGSKAEQPVDPALEQGYLESMYYIPTGMNASPDPPTADCFHKPSSMPPVGGRRT